MVWFAFPWSLVRLNNFTCVCLQFLFLSYEEWFQIFHCGIARICVFTKSLRWSWCHPYLVAKALTNVIFGSISYSCRFPCSPCLSELQNTLVNETSSPHLIQSHRKSGLYQISLGCHGPWSSVISFVSLLSLLRGPIYLPSFPLFPHSLHHLLSGK